MSNTTANSKQFDGRAPPRRRAKRDESDDQPIFLRKAYAMVSSCPPEIGGWSEKGDTVIIKDVKAFSEKVIPTAYKHNNFSSFVRQLNFYGFRKVKSESLSNPNWWEFRHVSFLRGRPDLLAEIKRSMHFIPEASGNVKEISELKSQVAFLTERLNTLNDQVEKLNGAFDSIHIGSSSSSSSSASSSIPSASSFQHKVGLLGPKIPSIKNEGSSNSKSSKKRKISQSPAIDLQRMNSLGSAAYIDDYRSTGQPLPSGDELENFDWDGQLMQDEGEDASMMMMTATPEMEEENFFNEIVEDLAFDVKQAADEVLTTTNNNNNRNNNDQQNVIAPSPVHAQLAPASMDSFSEVTSVIDKLPADLQIRFVDRLAEVVGLQLAATMNTQKLPIVKAEPYQEASSSYGSSSSSSSQNHKSLYQDYILPSGSKAPEIALPLASAAISAFLMTNLRTLPNQHTVVQQSLPIEHR